MPSRIASRLPALLIAAAVLVTGCSDDDGGGDEGAAEGAEGYVDARAEALASNSGAELFVYSEDEAQCIAEQEVEALGVDFLTDNGITTEELAGIDGLQDLGVPISEEQAQAAASALGSCDIAFGRLFTAGTGSDTVVACIDEAVDPEVIVQATVLRYLADEAGSGGVLAPTTAAINACITAG